MFKKIIKGFDEQGSHRNALMPEESFVRPQGSMTLPIPITNIGGTT